MIKVNFYIFLFNIFRAKNSSYMEGYIYLITTPDCRENPLLKGVYKIGKTEQKNPNNRISKYTQAIPPKTHIIAGVDHNVGECENKVIKHFNKKFKKHTQGKEYFLGNLGEMMSELMKIVLEHNSSNKRDVKVDFKALFEKSGKLIYELGDHFGYFIDWSVVAPFCKNWSKNRDLDETRIEEMVELYNKGGHIPRLLHIAEKKNLGLVCYDGNNRREVFERVGGVECLVDVIFGLEDDEKIIENFNNINKGIPLPLIYTQGDEDIKSQIIMVVGEYVKKYRERVSAAPHPYKGNFNRDSFVDLIYSYYEDLDKKYTIKQINDSLIKLNIAYSKGNFIKIDETSGKYDNCKKSNLWLFYKSSGPPLNHIQKFLTN